MRIRMPKGHVELSLEGTTFTPDETGAFNVPDHHAAQLIAAHGAVRETTVDDLIHTVEQADAAVDACKALLEMRVQEAASARARLDSAKKQAAIDAKARADEMAAAAKAMTEAETKQSVEAATQLKKK